jgi:hypothetical protein
LLAVVVELVLMAEAEVAEATYVVQLVLQYVDHLL